MDDELSWGAQGGGWNKKLCEKFKLNVDSLNLILETSDLKFLKFYKIYGFFLRKYQKALKKAFIKRAYQSLPEKMGYIFS